MTDKLRYTPWTSAILDGVARTAIIDPLTALISLATLVLLWRTSLNNAWYIAAGALIGPAHTLLT